jgi:hypothetical protein
MNDLASCIRGTRTEWRDLAGWKCWEVRVNGQLIESGRQSPDGRYDERTHHQRDRRAVLPYERPRP